MFNPYFLMTFLYLALAVLSALAAALINFGVLPVFAGLPWLRVHFITLGALTEFIFGIVPLLVAARNEQPRPQIRWDIWLALNVGLLTLLVGIPLINTVFITAGGSLIFLATVLLAVQVGRMRTTDRETAPSEGRRFYIVGLLYLLVGIIVGTGLWQGWSGPLQIKTPLEVHIHANTWGFMSMVFAGLIIDLYPSFSGHSFASPRTITRIFWLITFGALGLILGPWFQVNAFLAPGLILHVIATVTLLLNVIRPLAGDGKMGTPGALHITTAYVWLFIPLMAAPAVILQVPGFPVASIEASAPQALIYGWVLQFGYGMIPLLFRRIFLPDAPAKLGGNWFSLIAVHAGAILLWVGIFLPDARPVLHGLAYTLWAASIVPVALELWNILRTGMSDLMGEGAAPTAVPSGD